MLTEGITCARPHTKKWHLQGFNQVHLPSGQLPGQGMEAAVGLDYLDSVA